MLLRKYLTIPCNQTQIASSLSKLKIGYLSCSLALLIAASAPSFLKSSFSLVSQATSACLFEDIWRSLEPYTNKGLFPNLYKVLVSIPLGGALLDDCWLNISFVRVPNLHPSSQVIRYRKFFRRLSHASSFSELVPSLSQSRFTIKRGKSLYFRLGRSRHSRNFLVHPSIARVRIQSAHSERKKRSSWTSETPQSKCLSIDSYSFGQSIHGLFTPFYWEVHHVDRNRQRPSCTRPRGQHSWQSSVLSRTWYGFVLGVL